MPTLSLAGLLFVPTSPVYLVKLNQPHAALKSLKKLHGSNTSADILRARLAVIQHTVALEAEQKRQKGSPSFRDLWSNPVDRRRTITNAGSVPGASGCVLSLPQQYLAGLSSVRRGLFGERSVFPSHICK